MNFEKEYELCFSMTRDLFSLPRIVGLRRENSQSVQRSKFFAVRIETNHSGKRMLPADFFLATSITTYF
jgi:hypothetical protein